MKGVSQFTEWLPAFDASLLLKTGPALVLVSSRPRPLTSTSISASLLAQMRCRVNGAAAPGRAVPHPRLYPSLFHLPLRMRGQSGHRRHLVAEQTRAPQFLCDERFAMFLPLRERIAIPVMIACAIRNFWPSTNNAPSSGRADHYLASVNPLLAIVPRSFVDPTCGGGVPLPEYRSDHSVSLARASMVSHRRPISRDRDGLANAPQVLGQNR